MYSASVCGGRVMSALVAAPVWRVESRLAVPSPSAALCHYDYCYCSTVLSRLRQTPSPWPRITLPLAALMCSSKRRRVSPKKIGWRASVQKLHVRQNLVRRMLRAQAIKMALFGEGCTAPHCSCPYRYSGSLVPRPTQSTTLERCRWAGHDKRMHARTRRASPSQSDQAAAVIPLPPCVHNSGVCL